MDDLCQGCDRCELGDTCCELRGRGFTGSFEQVGSDFREVRIPVVLCESEKPVGGRRSKVALAIGPKFLVPGEVFQGGDTFQFQLVSVITLSGFVIEDEEPMGQDEVRVQVHEREGDMGVEPPEAERCGAVFQTALGALGGERG